MFNHFPYNHTKFLGVNREYTKSETPTRNKSLITAIGRVEQGLPVPRFVVGGRDSEGTHKLFKKGDSYEFNMWRSRRYTIGKPFQIDTIHLSFTQAVADNMLLYPVLDFDNGRRRIAGNAIEVATYPDSERRVVLGPYNFQGGVHGENDFTLEFHFRGSALLGIMLPIEINLTTEVLG